MFSDNTPIECRALIDSILQPLASERAGYKNYSDIKSSAFFKGMYLCMCIIHANLNLILRHIITGVNWNHLVQNLCKSISVTITPQPFDLKTSELFNPENEDNLASCVESIFDDF